MDCLEKYIQLSESIPGWCRWLEAQELASISYHLPDGAIIVEIGAFLGSSTVLLAGPRQLRGSGHVHSIDPFDCSGDSASVPHYLSIVEALNAGDSRRLAQALDRSNGVEVVAETPTYADRPSLHSIPSLGLRNHFEANIHRASLGDFVTVHQGLAGDIAKNWTAPVDLLFLDGDHSPQGARQAYESWKPFLKRGAIIALHNSAPGEYVEDHDGHRRLALEEIVPPEWGDIRLVLPSTTFARYRP